MNRIHIFGASGSGTTTLGKALANHLAIPFLTVMITTGKRLTHLIEKVYPPSTCIQRLLGA